MIIKGKKIAIFFGTLTLCSGLYSGCSDGGGRKEDAAVKAIATGANQDLIHLVKSNDDVKLKDVVMNAEKYGLTDEEISVVKNNITDWDKRDYVLEWINPLNRTGVPRWAYVPQSEDGKNAEILKTINSIDKEGQIDVIDGTTKPEQVDHPIITISLSEKIPGVEPIRLTEDGSLSKDVPVGFGELVMTSLKFKDDHEPWIKGKAEVYYVLSYIGRDGKVFVTPPNTKRLHHVQYEGIEYGTSSYHTTVLSWFNVGYRRVDIHFFEHDGTDWQPIIKSLNEGIVSITQSIQAIPMEYRAGIQIGSQVVDQILNLIPRGLFKDGDDYMDSIYTIRKRDTVGEEKIYVGANATAKFITENTYLETEEDPYASNESDIETEEDPLK